jgi:DNA-binding CsgD family transcriptional regulator
MHETKPPELDHRQLARLRLVAELLHRDGDSVPLAGLVGLARDVRLNAGVTIDFAASKSLGSPMMVLRRPTENRPSACLAPLSPRERDVAALVADGLSNKQIARRLGLTVGSVKDHVHRILTKTKLTNRAAVAAAWKGHAVPSRTQ